MTPVDPKTKESVEQLVNYAHDTIVPIIDAVESSATELERELNSLELFVAEQTIERNAKLANLYQQLTPASRALLADEMMRLATVDSMVLAGVRRASISAIHIGPGTRKATEHIDILNVMAAERIGDEHARWRDALDQQEARLLEHAKNNPAVRQKVWALTSGHCIYCNVELILTAETPEDWERVFNVDHIVPKSCGGPDHITNYVPACGRCNNDKRDLPVAEFITLKHMKQGTLVLMKVLPDGLPSEAEFVRCANATMSFGPGREAFPTEAVPVAPDKEASA